jgi:chitin biosynthesis protein CHS5
MIPISAFYLGVTHSTPTNSASFTRPQSMSQTSLPQSSQAAKAANRTSMPAPSQTAMAPGPTSSADSESPSKAARKTFEPTPEEIGDGNESHDLASDMKSMNTKNRGPPRTRHGTMDREFKFPPTSVPPASDAASSGQQAAVAGNKADAGTRNATSARDDGIEEVGLTAVNLVTPSSVEVPPPPPIEKERPPTNHDDAEDDVGETVEISLN